MERAQQIPSNMAESETELASHEDYGFDLPTAPRLSEIIGRQRASEIAAEARESEARMAQRRRDLRRLGASPFRAIR